MKIILIEDWKQAWRLWSIQFAAVVALLPELLYRIGDVLPALSPIVVDYLPGWLRATCAVLGLVATALRVVQQPSRPLRGRDERNP